MVASTTAMKTIRATRDVMGDRTGLLIALSPVHPIRGPSSDDTGGGLCDFTLLYNVGIERAPHACRNVTATSPADTAAGFGAVGHCANEAPPAVRHQRLHASHYSFVDPEEARFLSPALIVATCLTGVPERIVEQLKELESQGLSQIMRYPPLNRQYRVIEDFADRVMDRL